MLEKIKNTDFREVAVTLGIIGLFVIIVSITSDTKQEFHEWITGTIIGVIIMLLSFGYIFWYEIIKK